MSLENLLGKDQAVEVTLWQDDKEEPRLVFKTTILGFAGGNKFLVGFPADKSIDKNSIKKMVEPNSVVGVVAYKENSPLIVIYPVVESVQTNTALQGIWLKLLNTEQAEMVQRRFHFRIDLNLPVAVKQAGDDDDTPPAKGTTLDMSGGGLKFTSRRRYEKDEALVVSVQFPEEAEPVDVHCEVVYSSDNRRKQADGSDAFITACRYSANKMDQRTETLIMKECFRAELGLKTEEGKKEDT